MDALDSMFLDLCVVTVRLLSVHHDIFGRPPANLKLLTPAQTANAVALQNAMVWFSAVGAGPALLAMLLRGHGWVRRALACVGLASALANHCIISWILGVTIVITATEDDLFLLSVISAMSFTLFAVVDVKSAMFLLRRRGP